MPRATGSAIPPEELERVFERCGPFDYVYHCAAEFGRWNGEDFYETLWRTNAIEPCRIGLSLSLS